MGELYQQQASSHQGLIKDKQPLNRCYGLGSLMAALDAILKAGSVTLKLKISDIFLHISSLVNERNLQLDPKSSIWLMSDASSKEIQGKCLIGFCSTSHLCAY